VIHITGNIIIDDKEIQEEFIRASGPGGQNVNKVATAVQLRFDVTNSCSLPDKVRQRLLLLAGKHITEEGILIIDARQFRTQKANRQDAKDRLVELIRSATKKPKIRRKTKPTLSSKVRRLEVKHHHAKTKYWRRPISDDNSD
jgi:ribosome-associated protein